MALVLTACASTEKRLVTAPVEVVEVPTLPPVPTGLLVAPVRPNPPVSGTPEALLVHAVEFGAYVGELENQNSAWREWTKGNRQNGR